MAFPSSPTIGQEYDESGVRFYWDGTVWRVKGHIGPEGPPGQVGAQGIQGIQGIQGTTGIQGIQGVQGIQGPSATGTQGIQGVQGIQGIQGIQSVQGIQGIQGLSGLSLGSGAEDSLWNSSNTDIDGLIPGTTAGRLSTGPTNGHYVIGIKSNDTNDGFYVIDQGTAGATGAEPFINNILSASSLSFTYKNNDIWHAGNFGKTQIDALNVDADTLDGIDGSWYVQGATANRTGAIISSDWNNSLPSGFFEASAGTNAPDANWWWGINTRHSNVSNQYGWQMLGKITTNDYRLRYVSNGTWGPWVTMWHSGNFGKTEIDALNVDADTLDGEDLVDSAATVNTVVGRNGSGDIFARLIRETFPNESTISGGMVFRVNNSTDNYLRVCSSPTAIATFLGLGTGNNVAFTTIKARVAAGSVTTGTLTAAGNANQQVTLTGNITVPNSIFTAGDILILSAGSAARTITRGTGVTMYVGGVNSATATLAARGTAGIRWETASICYVTGDV